MTINWMGTTYR